MKKILLVALLPFVFFSCEKDKDTNPQFREVTCDDTTDDGIFEQYTQPEKNAFLSIYKSVPDAATAGAIDFVGMTSRKLYNNSIVYDPSLIYKQSQKTNLIVYLPLDVPYKYYSWVVNDTNTHDTLSVPIYNVRSLKLPEGCHRLYYVFADTTNGTVLNKGHFDFEIIR
jgi:hypothetical protein